MLIYLFEQILAPKECRISLIREGVDWKGAYSLLLRACRNINVQLTK